MIQFSDNRHNRKPNRDKTGSSIERKHNRSLTNRPVDSQSGPCGYKYHGSLLVSKSLNSNISTPLHGTAYKYIMLLRIKCIIA